MKTFIIRRLLQSVVVVIGVTIIIFLIMRLLPGDPIQVLVTKGDLSGYSEERIEQLREEFGLNRPLVVQYLDWLWKALHGDLGISILHRYDVWDEIMHRLPITLHLGISAFIIGIVVGPIAGVISAVRRASWLDNLMSVLANIGITAPQFWLGIILIYVFGLKLKLFPVFGYVSPFEDLWLSVKHSIMPILCLSVFPMATAARQTRAMVIEVMNQDYIRIAWSKGLSEKVIILRHVFKNALIPVVTLQGVIFRNIVGGAVVIETVFVIPGMGSFMVNSMLSQDYPVLQGVILVMAVAVVFINLIVDLLYGWLDPRIQYE